MLDSYEYNPKPILRLRDLGDEMKNPTPWLIKTCFCFHNLDTLNQPWNVIYIQYWGQHLDLEKWLFILAGMMLLSTKKLGNLSSSGQWLALYRDITRVAVNMALSINYHYILERWEPSIMFHNPPFTISPHKQSSQGFSMKYVNRQCWITYNMEYNYAYFAFILGYHHCDTDNDLLENFLDFVLLNSNSDWLQIST